MRCARQRGNQPEKIYHAHAATLFALTIIASNGFAQGERDIQLTPIATLATGIFNDAAAEIVAHDPTTQRLFVTNVAAGTLDVFDISDPTIPFF